MHVQLAPFTAGGRGTIHRWQPRGFKSTELSVDGQMYQNRIWIINLLQDFGCCNRTMAAFRTIDGYYVQPSRYLSFDTIYEHLNPFGEQAATRYIVLNLLESTVHSPQVSAASPTIQ